MAVMKLLIPKTLLSSLAVAAFLRKRPGIQIVQFLVVAK